MEWAGAFGDLGTLIPFVVAYIAVAVDLTVEPAVTESGVDRPATGRLHAARARTTDGCLAVDSLGRGEGLRYRGFSDRSKASA
jgi:hypothetical protein